MTQQRMHIAGLQLGQARKVMMSGRNTLTAIAKIAASGPVAVGPLGLLGDEQADLSVHGGLDKAVYAYPVEHYPFWMDQRESAGISPLAPALPYGALGENLTLSGVMEKDVWVGDLLLFPQCTLRVTQPREPCFKFNAAMGFNQASKVMAQTGRCGFYLAVDVPGVLTVGDACVLVHGQRRVGIPERFKATMFKNLR